MTPGCFEFAGGGGITSTFTGILRTAVLGKPHESARRLALVVHDYDDDDDGDEDDARRGAPHITMTRARVAMTAGNSRDMDAFYARASNPDPPMTDDDSPYLHVAGSEGPVLEISFSSFFFPSFTSRDEYPPSTESTGYFLARAPPLADYPIAPENATVLVGCCHCRDERRGAPRLRAYARKSMAVVRIAANSHAMPDAEHFAKNNDC